MSYADLSPPYIVFMCVHTHMFGFLKWIYSNRTALSHAALSKYSLPSSERLAAEEPYQPEILVPVLILRRAAWFSPLKPGFQHSSGSLMTSELSINSLTLCNPSLEPSKRLLFFVYGCFVHFSRGRIVNPFYTHTWDYFFEAGSQDAGWDENCSFKETEGQNA